MPRTWSEPPADVVSARPGIGRRLIRRIVGSFVFPTDTPATIVRRVTTFVIGVGALVTVILLGGYHQGYMHGADGLVWGAVIVVLALLASRGIVRPPGPGGSDPYPD